MCRFLCAFDGSPIIVAGAAAEQTQAARAYSLSASFYTVGTGRMVELLDRYRRNAEKCLRLAQVFNDLDAKRALLVMANAWLTLAAQRQKNIETAPYNDPTSPVNKSPRPLDEPPKPPPVNDPAPAKEPPLLHSDPANKADDPMQC